MAKNVDADNVWLMMVAAMGTELLHGEVARDFPDYLRDESRKVGRAQSIAFPCHEEEIREALEQAAAAGWPVTVQGGRTGITGGAVPDGGLILNLSRMNRVLGLRRASDSGAYLLTVQPGVVLKELRMALARREVDTAAWSPEALAAWRSFRTDREYFFPPDPTETSATIGGMVACNASGACSYRYGPTRAHVEALRVVLVDGDGLALRRGRERAQGRAFRVTTLSGRVLSGRLPAYRLPAVKNAAGLFVADDMDLLDLFIGSEGILGVIVEVELRLTPLPAVRCGLMAFFPTLSAALAFVHRVRGAGGAPSGPGTEGPAAMEFFDARALELLRTRQAEAGGTGDIPAPPPGEHTAVYVEYHGTAPAVEAGVAAAAEALSACGGSEEATWLADHDRELERLKDFRHAVPETVNTVIDRRRRQVPGLTKLGTDMAVPDAHLDAVVAMYQGDLETAGLEYVMFGHIGDNHLHVNILPRTLAEYERGRALYLRWARRVVELGGTVSAEHGIGKFKTGLLREMYGAGGIEAMRAVKRVFDPQGLLNRGNMFEP